MTGWGWWITEPTGADSWSVGGERINKPRSRLVVICNHPPLLWTRFTDCAEWRGPKYGGGTNWWTMDQHTAADDYFYVYEKNIFIFNSYFRVDNGFKKLVHKQMNSRPILICTVVFKAWEQNLVKRIFIGYARFSMPF